MPSTGMKAPEINAPKVEASNAPVLGGLWPTFGIGSAEMPKAPTVDAKAPTASAPTITVPTIPVINVAVPNVDQEKPKMKYIPPWPFSGF